MFKKIIKACFTNKNYKLNYICNCSRNCLELKSFPLCTKANNKWTEKSLNFKLSSMKTSYKEFENDLFNVLSGGKNTFVLSKFTYGLKKSGLKPNDQRLKVVYEKIDSLKATRNTLREDDINVSFEEMKELLTDNIVVIRNAFISNMVIPNFSDFCVSVDDLYWLCRKNLTGNITSHSKVLFNQRLESWAVSFCTVDGQRHSVGDYNTPVLLHTCCTPVNYALAVNRHGANIVNQYVSNELVSKNYPGFDKVLYFGHSNTPQDSLDIPGALMISSLLNVSQNSQETLENIIEKYNQLSGRINPNISWNKNFYLHESSSGDGARAYAYHLKNNSCFPNGTDLDQTVDLLFKLYSLEMTVECLAILAATLANDGICPVTGDRILSSEAVQSTLSNMVACGISNCFSFKVGIPIVTGISGGILLVYPGLMGAFTWSPPLNECNISVRGAQFCEQLSEIFDLHYFSFRPVKDHYNIQPEYDSNKESPPDLVNDSLPLETAFVQTPSKFVNGFPGLPKLEYRTSQTVQAIFAASLGDLNGLRALFLKGHNMDDADYDDRTPLHLAASQGNIAAVKFLVEKCKVNVDVKDRWGSTPLDDAKSASKVDVANYLESHLSQIKNNNNNPCTTTTPQTTS